MEGNYKIIAEIEEVLNRNGNVDIVIDDGVYELATPAQLETALKISKAAKGAKQIWLRRGGVDLLYYRVEDSSGNYCRYDINDAGVIRGGYWRFSPV